MNNIEQYQLISCATFSTAKTQKYFFSFTRVKISELLFSLRDRGFRHCQQLVNPVTVLRRNLSQGRVNAGMLRNFCLVDEASAHEGVEVVARVLLLIHAVKKAGRSQNAAFGEANVR
jgi:hypothetical protein